MNGFNVPTIKIETKHDDRVIIQTLVDGVSGAVALQVMDTKEETLRAALVAMGWAPPDQARDTLITTRGRSSPKPAEPVPTTTRLRYVRTDRTLYAWKAFFRFAGQEEASITFHASTVSHAPCDSVGEVVAKLREFATLLEQRCGGVAPSKDDTK